MEIDSKYANTLRLSPASTIILSSASDMDSIRDATKLIGPLVGDSILEVCRAAKYDEKTGSGLEYAWVPYDKWNGILWVGAGLPSIKDDSALFKCILATLDPFDIAIIGDIIVEYQPKHSDGLGMIYQRLIFKKARFVID